MDRLSYSSENSALRRNRNLADGFLQLIALGGLAANMASWVRRFLTGPDWAQINQKWAYTIKLIKLAG